MRDFGVQNTYRICRLLLYQILILKRVIRTRKQKENHEQVIHDLRRNMQGFKAFDSDLCCRGYQYEVGKTYMHEGSISLCSNGFHFCKKLDDCFNYYEFSERPRICEVEAVGEVIDSSDKCVTDTIKIIRELEWVEVLPLVNIGKENTGRANSGNRNSGYGNSGDWNSGDWNSGDWNSGYGNSGDWNSGYGNSGNRNSGDWNSGNGNSGNRNSGDWNSGNRNSGDWNSGYGNSGNRNSGDWNSGYGNSGNRNSGDWNSGNGSSGVLCTFEPELLIFDKPSGMTFSQWRDSSAFSLMCRIEFKTTEWIDESDMSSEEKENHPEFEIIGGFLRSYPEQKYAFSEWWETLSDDEKDTIRSIPNFEKSKWKTITGIEA